MGLNLKSGDTSGRSMKLRQVEFAVMGLLSRDSVFSVLA